MSDRAAASPDLRRRPVAWLLLGVTAMLFAACASSSTDQAPFGPPPAVTVLYRFGGSDGPQLQVLGTGVEADALGTAADAIALGSLQPDQVNGSAQNETTEDGIATSTIPLIVADGPIELTLRSEDIDAALKPLKPRSVAVWACTDSRRTIQVTSEDAGAVSSDVASGTCQIAGSSIAKEGSTWTATVAVGAEQPPSVLPVLIGTSVLLIGVGAAVTWLRGRRGADEEPAARIPPGPPVH